jgi:CheY-like chemotaxis protein
VEKGLDVAYLLDPDVPAAIFGDATRLRQILVNLLSNAIKFTEHGEVVVTVGLDDVAAAHQREEAAKDGEGDALHFAVHDTGIGIPQGRMDRLFEAFTQMDASMTRRYGGTGLGLAISRRLTDMMGGRMWVESEGIPGRGSTFHFTIQVEAAPSPPRAYLDAAQPDLLGRRVLIVDDNATNRKILMQQTEAWGMLPRATASPTEALDWVQCGDEFDVALLDMQMPEMDGMIFAATLAEAYADGLRPCPTVMLSSGQWGESLDEIQVAAILTKPIKPSHLYNILVQILAEDTRAKWERDEEHARQFDSVMGTKLPLRILVAEDNVINQQVALSFLSRLGYRADVAANGLEVLASVRRQPYDCVLMDVQMPEMDGLEAARRIRDIPASELAAGAQPSIIAMTANALREDRETCLAAGMDDYVSKPIQVAELIRALRGCRPGGHEVRAMPGEAAESLPLEALSPPSTPTAQVGALQVLDSGALAQLRVTLGKQADRLLPELIEGFYGDGKRLLAEARQALQAGNAADLHRAAHSLKATAATFGAMALSAVARDLEQLTRDGVLEGAGGEIARAEAEFARARTALEATQYEP